MNLTLSLIKINVLHMNSENKTDCSTSSQKQAQITTEKNNTMLSKKSRGRQKYVQHIVKGTRHGKQLIERKIFHIKRNIGYFEKSVRVLVHT